MYLVSSQHSISLEHNSTRKFLPFYISTNNNTAINIIKLHCHQLNFYTIFFNLMRCKVENLHQLSILLQSYSNQFCITQFFSIPKMCIMRGFLLDRISFLFKEPSSLTCNFHLTGFDLILQFPSPVPRLVKHNFELRDFC